MKTNVMIPRDLIDENKVLRIQYELIGPMQTVVYKFDHALCTK